MACFYLGPPCFLNRLCHSGIFIVTLARTQHLSHLVMFTVSRCNLRRKWRLTLLLLRLCALGEYPRYQGSEPGLGTGPRAAMHWESWALAPSNRGISVRWRPRLLELWPRLLCTLWFWFHAHVPPPAIWRAALLVGGSSRCLLEWCVQAQPSCFIFRPEGGERSDELLHCSLTTFPFLFLHFPLWKAS